MSTASKVLGPHGTQVPLVLEEARRKHQRTMDGGTVDRVSPVHRPLSTDDYCPWRTPGSPCSNSIGRVKTAPGLFASGRGLPSGSSTRPKVLSSMSAVAV